MECNQVGLQVAFDRWVFLGWEGFAVGIEGLQIWDQLGLDIVRLGLEAAYTFVFDRERLVEVLE